MKRVDGISGTLGFPVECPLSLMLTTMVIVAVGVNRTILQRVLEDEESVRPRFPVRSIGMPRPCPTLQLPLCLFADGIE